jgi:hypothetical protein
MTAADLAARADRVAQIAKAVYGRVLSRNRNTMVIEIPADTMTGAVTLLGMSGFSAILGKQSTKLAERRVVDTNGNVVTCPNDLVTTAFFTYTVDLRPHGDAAKPAPSAADITRPTKP